MSVMREYKVYGRDGHRLAITFEPSFKWDWTHDGDVRILECDCSDVTGTNDYAIVRITRNTVKECDKEFKGQLSDGLFENMRTGSWEIVRDRIIL